MDHVSIRNNVTMCDAAFRQSSSTTCWQLGFKRCNVMMTFKSLVFDSFGGQLWHWDMTPVWKAWLFFKFLPIKPTSSAHEPEDACRLDCRSIRALAHLLKSRVLCESGQVKWRHWIENRLQWRMNSERGCSGRETGTEAEDWEDVHHRRNDCW